MTARVLDGSNAAIEIRAATAETVRPSLAPLSAAFGDPFTDEELDEGLRVWETDRIIAAWEGGGAVATAGNCTFQLTVPGGHVAAAGLTLVGVIPTHRRRGILTSMMRWQFEDSARRAEPVSILWASEAVIYQRYGYGLATLNARLETVRGRARLSPRDDGGGSFRSMTADDAAAALPPLYDRIRPTIPGMVSRSAAWWRHELLGDSPGRSRGAGPKSVVAYEAAGVLEGYAVYRTKSEWDERGPKGTVTVLEVIGVTPEAERALWDWLLRLDLFPTLVAVHQPVPHPLQLLVAEPRALGMTVGDGIWLRLLDVPGALAARRYGITGSLVLEVRDRFLPANAGRWALTATADGSGRVEATRVEPDIALDVSDLAAMYLGTFRAFDLWRAGRVEPRRPGGLWTADAMFASARAPWCGTPF
jgi:predicted acetyltransferase